MIKRFVVVLVLLFACQSGQVLAESQRTSADKKSAAASAASGGFLIEATPKWISAVPAGDGAPVERSSMHNELIDEQSQISSRGVETYSHIVRVVDGVDGLTACSEVRVDFNPSYETLTFHKIEIWRGAVRINKLDRSRVKVLHRESNLEYQIYDGALTATLVLDDVRIGDRVEFSYSIKGSNPVFDEKYVHTAWMASIRGPTKVARFRLLAPESRSIRHRSGADVTVKETRHDGLRDTEFVRLSAPQLHGDQFTPSSVYLNDQINLSEFADWQEIANWGAKLYASVLNTPSAQVKSTVQSFGITDKTPVQEKIRLALNFVQKEVRYFGTEVGENTHRPTAPDLVIKQRFGDCKDKVLLLVALLKEMGIEAQPVLVSTLYRNDIDSSFATPLFFNHVIARVTENGNVYWLDGTRSAQTGPVVKRQSAGLGKGLILNSSVVELTDLPGTELEERLTVEEFLKVKALSEAPVLALHMTFYGEMAEYLRDAVSSQPLETLESKLNTDFARFHPNVKKIAPLKIEEIEGENAVRVVQLFSVPKYWRFPDEKKLVGDYSLWGLIAPIRYTEETSRSQPYQINYPGIYRHTFSIEYPEDMVKTGSNGQLREDDPHLNFQLDWDFEPKKYQVRSELHLIQGAVTISEWPAYTTFLRKISPKFAGAFYVSPISFAQGDKLKSDIDAMTGSWRGLFAKNSPVTDVQSDAMVKRIVYTAELEGGRLNPELRAQVLHRRGIQLDTLGLYELGKADFDEALKLSSNDAEILATAAVNSFSLGQDARALEYAAKSSALDVNSTPYRIMAHVNYFGKNYAEAKKNLLAQLKVRNEVDNGYAAILLYLTARRNQEDALAAVKNYSSKNSSAWPYPVLHFLTGQASYEKALEAAKAGQKDASRLCELYFYVGEKHLIDGQVDLAREFFKKSLDTGVVEFSEYIMAKRSMQQLDNL
jgi:lipoprotein NlpI/transglutaminase-like putative cysteine protease